MDAVLLKAAALRTLRVAGVKGIAESDELRGELA
jgi:hypothetical protein